MANIQEFLGTDLRHEQDFVKTESGGDLQTISGLDNLKAAVIRRIMTLPGEVIHRPNYGAGLTSFQNAPNTQDTRRAIAAKIEEQLLRDPRIEGVESISFSNTDSRPELVTIAVHVLAKGYGELPIEFRPFGEIA
jgi:phage baseplate assembly protein W